MEDDSTQEPRAEAVDAVAEPDLVESFVGSYPTHVLETLLADRTTGRNIVWANDEYSHLGEGYGEDDQMTVSLITGKEAGLIQPRVQKRLERQSGRTKSRARPRPSRSATSCATRRGARGSSPRPARPRSPSTSATGSAASQFPRPSSEAI